MSGEYYPKTLGAQNFKAVQEGLNKLNQEVYSVKEENNKLRQEVNNLKLQVQNMTQEQNLAKALANNGGPTVQN